MTPPPTFKPDDIELVPDAWGRFERAVDTVSKSGPQHRAAHKAPKSFVEAANALALLLDQPGCPRNVADSAARLIQHMGKCVFVKPQVGVAAGASEASVLLQPSDLFLRFVSAVRAKNWPLVSIIEHEATS
jgi:hypothetical protein